MTSTSWRDRIKVHPAADLFPMMSDAELDALGADILKNQLVQRVILWTPEPLSGRRYGKPPEKVYLLDGRNRLAAIERAVRDPEERAEYLAEALYLDRDERWGAYLLRGDEVDPWTFVISANVHRRHLTHDQKRDLVAALLTAKPERSDRATSALAKVSPTTVGAVRRELEAAGTVSSLDTRIGKDGIAQPAAKPNTQSKEVQIRALREQQTSAAIAASPVAPPPSASRYGIVDELETLLRVVRGDRRRLDSLALEKRVDLVRQLMAFLKIEVADLGMDGDAP